MLTIIKRGLNIKTLRVMGLAAALAFAAIGCGPPGERAQKKGERLMSQGKYAEAAQKFEEAAALLKTAPASQQALAYDWQGVALESVGQPAPAAEAYKNARRLDRDMAPAIYNLGCLYLEHGNFRDAIDLFQTCLGLTRRDDISDANIFLKLGCAYLRQGNRSSGAERTRNLDASKRYFDAAHAAAPSPETANALGLLALLRTRSANEAINRFKEALKMDAAYSPAILNMAITHQRYLNDPKMALDDFTAYLAAIQDPREPQPAAADDVRALMKSLRESADETAPAPASRPVPPKTGAAKTNAPAKPSAAPSVSKPAPEERGLSRAAGALPGPSAGGSPESRTPGPGLRYSYAATVPPAEGNRDEAARLVSLGYAAQQQQKWSNAIALYQRAIKADPRCYDACYLLGAAARQNGNLPVALEALERASLLQPDSADARYAFAFTLRKASYFRDSAAELEKLLQQASEDTRAHLLLASVYAQDLKEPSRARAHFQKVLEIDPGHPQAQTIRQWLEPASAENASPAGQTPAR